MPLHAGPDSTQPLRFANTATLRYVIATPASCRCRLPRMVVPVAVRLFSSAFYPYGSWRYHSGRTTRLVGTACRLAGRRWIVLL